MSWFRDSDSKSTMVWSDRRHDEHALERGKKSRTFPKPKRMSSRFLRSTRGSDGGIVDARAGVDGDGDEAVVRLAIADGRPCSTALIANSSSIKT
jgi:hypothetical protein